MLFRSYQEAHERMSLPGSYQKEINSDEIGITSLKLTDHADSYNRYTNGGRTIYYVGEGRRKSPGHPAGNQMQHRQEAFSKSWALQTSIPVLHKRSDNTVTLLGYYRVASMCKRLGNEGFTYFVFELRQELYDLPPGPIVPRLPSSLASTPTTSSSVSVSATSATAAPSLTCYRCNIIQNLINETPVKGIPLRSIK